MRSTIGHHFVHVFKANNDDTVFIKCCSGVCSKRYSKLVNLRKMDEVNLCPHLDVFQLYIDSNWEKHRLLTLIRSQLYLPNKEVNQEDNQPSNYGDDSDSEFFAEGDIGNDFKR